MAEIDPQEFWQLKAEVTSLRRDQTIQMTQMAQLLADTAQIREQLAEAKGGWRMLMLLGGAAGASGAALASFFTQKV